MSRPLWNGTVVKRPSACRNCLCEPRCRTSEKPCFCQQRNGSAQRTPSRAPHGRQSATALLGSWNPDVPGRVLSPTATPGEVSGAIARYDAEIAYLDGQLGRFFDYLKALDRYRSSLIVVVGDHGEEFTDHGGVYHGHTLFREQLHVPYAPECSGEPAILVWHAGVRPSAAPTDPGIVQRREQRYRDRDAQGQRRAP